MACATHASFPTRPVTVNPTMGFLSVTGFSPCRLLRRRFRLLARLSALFSCETTIARKLSRALYPKREREGKPPLPPAAHSFFAFPPPKNRNGNERQGQRAATRGTPRGAGSESWHAIGAYEKISSHHALGACEVSRDFC